MKVPDPMVAEIIDGDLYAWLRPASPYARAWYRRGDLWSLFDRPSPGPGGWWILDEPELHLAEDVLVPDVAGWRLASMPLLPNVAAFTADRLGSPASACS